MMGWMWQLAPTFGMWTVVPLAGVVLVLTFTAIGAALTRREEG